MSSYYILESRIEKEGSVIAIYDSTVHAQGAWNPNEQHMAPATGVICAELEAFMPREDMQIARISFDIFGMIAFGKFSIKTSIIRQGRTIELIESVMTAQNKTCIVARAWRLQTGDTTSVAGKEDTPVVLPDELPDWDGMLHWGGGYIHSIYTKAYPNNRAGKGIVWINNKLAMVSHQGQVLPTSDFVHLMGMVDTANGIAPRIQQTDKSNWIFPNVDLQIHLWRMPAGLWLGLETVQQIGENGIGLTSSILHDTKGAFGRSEQILTVRHL